MTGNLFGNKWTQPSIKQQRRVGTDDVTDGLAASEKEIAIRALREQGYLSLKYLQDMKVVCRLMELPNTPFFFGDIGIHGDRIPRYASNSGIVEPARKAIHCRWSKVCWKTTELYQYVKKSYRDSVILGKIKLVMDKEGLYPIDIMMDDNLIRTIK